MKPDYLKSKEYILRKTYSFPVSEWTANMTSLVPHDEKVVSILYERNQVIVVAEKDIG